MKNREIILKIIGTHPIKIIGLHPIFSKIDYSAVSQTAKRFEQETKVNYKIGRTKQKSYSSIER